ncbi:MAG TPA: helicase HerA-like domain-containing protein, partial [Pseudorhizobium sp.]|nr:helicase HerA-like domain-containing protein [Pseudorhizobium sp.]
VERTLIRPPSSRIGPLSDAERQDIINRSPIAGQYDRDVDRESAYEILMARAKKAEAAKHESEEGNSAAGRWTLPGFGDEPEEKPVPRRGSGRSGYQRETVVEAAMKSAARSMANSLGRAIVRGILGSLKR